MFPAQGPGFCLVLWPLVAHQRPLLLPKIQTPASVCCHCTSLVLFRCFFMSNQNPFLKCLVFFFFLCILPYFPFLSSSNGVQSALFFSPLSSNPSEYLGRAVLLSPQLDVACFLLLLYFFPSLHSQFNHRRETSTVFHLGAETVLPETTANL